MKNANNTAEKDPESLDAVWYESTYREETRSLSYRKCFS